MLHRLQKLTFKPIQTEEKDVGFTFNIHTIMTKPKDVPQKAFLNVVLKTSTVPCP